MIVVFTEYVLPNGRQRPKNIRVVSKDNIAMQYKMLLNEGYHFDYEILQTGIESITCEKDEDCVGHELVFPPRTIQRAVVDLIYESYVKVLHQVNQASIADVNITP